MKQSIKELQVNWAIKIKRGKKKKKKEKKKDQIDELKLIFERDWDSGRFGASICLVLSRTPKKRKKKKKLNPKIQIPIHKTLGQFPAENIKKNVTFASY